MDAAAAVGIEPELRAIHPDNEHAVLAALTGVVDASLEEFSTSVEEDKELLQAKSIQGLLRCVIIFSPHELFLVVSVR